jgi:S1-C subfamily serine protease
MEFRELYRSVFAILKIQGQNATVAGTGFVINTNPIYILTCNHVVSEGNEQNNGNVRYSITKRTDNFDEFDLRQAQISFYRARRIVFNPENDLAILEIDPAENQQVFNQLNIGNSPALELSFDSEERIPGTAVEWLSTVAAGDLTLTPRFFKGNLITKYKMNQNYIYRNNHGVNITQTMNGVDLFEVDKLFIPGSSGSPILDIESSRVIGYVHGFRSWPITTGTSVSHPVELTENGNIRNVSLRYNMLLGTSLSLGIDLRTVETYLRENHFI